MSRVKNGFEARALRDSWKNVSDDRETSFDFSFKGLVDKKRFNDFNNFSRSVKIGQFVERRLGHRELVGASLLYFSPSYWLNLVSKSVVECSGLKANCKDLIFVYRSFCM